MPPLKTNFVPLSRAERDVRRWAWSGARQHPWRTIGIIALGLAELWVVWRALHTTLGASSQLWLNGISMFILTSLLALVLVLTLQNLPLSPAWAGRGGLVISLLPVILAITPTGMTPFFILIAGSGAFCGVLVLTGLQEGLWEDNLYPPKQVEVEVQEWHHKRLGKPGKLPFAKRLFDIGLAATGLIVSSPVCLVITLLIWLDDPGPFLFVKNSVGKGGQNFRQLKFRTLVRDAEKATGPILTGYEDERVLFIGRVLRKTALDELPQLVNILRGEMSFVGPRPQRTVLVHGYLQTIPGYAERHRVPPGLSGLAQVVGSYFMTPEEKLRWDRLYIERISLVFDLKLILLAFLVVFWLRWQKDWDERLPDRYLKFS
jgi:lipopolysaccharide/colanic/teichoic acid biosynthesis glycosyltransferase